MNNQENKDISEKKVDTSEKIEVIEPLKEVVINENSSNKVHYVFLVILFIFLFAIVFFLPDITNLVGTLKSKQTEDNGVITTGMLICKLEDASDTFDYSYTDQFSFVDNSFKTLTHQVVIKGDVTIDYENLDLLNTQCLYLQEVAKTINGIDVKCENSNNTVTDIQTFNYEILDPTQISSAYIEAGGILPTYSLNTDITTIEKQMNAQGYTCERIK